MSCSPTGAEINLRRRGGGLDVGRLKRRIERNVEIDPDTGCWNWKGRIKNSGYGEIAVRIPNYTYPRKFLAHRVAFECWKGALRRGQVVAHTECDNPRCCNPGHLKATTQRENMKECREKGRARQKRYKCEEELIRPLLEPHLVRGAGEVRA